VPKISGIDVNRIASIDAGRPVARSTDAPEGAPRGAAGSPVEDVQITGTARHLANLEQAVRDLPVLNEARVAHIRAQIEQGTYTVRPQHVADQLMSMERALNALPDAQDADAQSGDPQGGDPQGGHSQGNG
jgi:negative regulator of flagellin synthesis FlgM